MYRISTEQLIELNKTVQWSVQRRQIVQFLNLRLYGRILDIGERNPQTDELEAPGRYIENTKGDLDERIYLNGMYDHVVYSHVVQHQFNPLGTLLQIRDHLKVDGWLYICLPERPKFLWDIDTYHEPDEYRLNQLVKRAGFKVIAKRTFRAWRGWKFHLSGIRPLLRIFLEKNVIYACR